MIVAGNWTLERTLGFGATATVSLASSSSSGELFAVKSSPLSRSALLRREQSILGSLCSPYIVSCLGSEISGDTFHLFLEFASGGALSELAGRLDEGKIRSFTRQILLALCCAHSNGVSHCDVKGRNVLVFSDGSVKLGDFGCARRAKEEEFFSGAVMGTPAFMAPEVARGEEQGPEGDIWALGCTVLEMVGGGSPWPEAEDAFSAMYRVGFTSDVPSIPGWISQEGKDFILKCFERDPKQRWTAERLLLSHPFVAGDEEGALALSEKQRRWVSPKSTLEFGFWDLETEEEEDDAADDGEILSSERIRQLASSEMAGWAWDEEWVAVRGSEEDSSACEVETECLKEDIDLCCVSYSSEKYVVFEDLCRNPLICYLGVNNVGFFCFNLLSLALLFCSKLMEIESLRYFSYTGLIYVQAH